MDSPSQSGEMVERAIVAARDGYRPALGQVLEFCRKYLLLTANQELEPELRAKIAPSDVVQKTYLEACRDFDQFRGHTEAELLGWLRSILHHNLANIRRDFCETGKRRLDLERQFQCGFDYISKDCVTPGAVLVAQEQREFMIRAIEQLPDHYREVLRLRQQDNFSFAKIGQQMGRTPESARKLWARAVEQLAEILNVPCPR